MLRQPLGSSLCYLEITFENINDALDDLIDGIAANYEFNRMPNAQDVKYRCKIDMISILHKFDPTKNKKAFSYFTVCVKNWFFGEYKRLKKKKSKESSHSVDVYLPYIESAMSEEDSYHSYRESAEFVHYFLKRFKELDLDKYSEKEKKVHAAIVYLVENEESIEIIKKSAMRKYISEITGIKRSRIYSLLRKFTDVFKDILYDWENLDVI